MGEIVRFAESVLSRQELLRRGLGAAAALVPGVALAACGGGDGEPSAAQAEPAAQDTAGPEAASTFDGTLRVLGIRGIDLIEPVREAAERDLGFNVEFDATDPPTLFDKIFAEPGSFDVVSAYHFAVDWMWPSGNVQPLEIARIERWAEIAPFLKLGRLGSEESGCTFGEGDAPFRKLYVDPGRNGFWPTSPQTPSELDGLIVQWVDEASGQPVGAEPSFCSGVPGILGFDSLAFNADVFQREPAEVSWGELLNGTWSGRVALQSFAPEALIETGLAARALGLMDVENLGNPSTQEIDGLVEILAELNAGGHFRAFWQEFEESVELMASGEVVVQSMWYPALALLQAQQFPVLYAAPPEGYRGFSGALGVSASVTDQARLQACYDYINWWLSGPPAAIMMRQGYYNGVQETSRAFVEPGEYAYWIEGKPAERDYPGPFGDVSIQEGQVREGGSFAERACRVGVWNSTFEQGQYAIERFSETLLT